MNSTEPRSSWDRMPTKSLARSSAGPLVTRKGAPSSSAKTKAREVLPRPGPPEKLGELLRHRREVHADADGVAATATDRAGVHVGELGPRRLGPDGVGVGHVVADHLEVLARGIQTGKALLEAHGLSLVGKFLGRGSGFS